MNKVKFYWVMINFNVWDVVFISKKQGILRNKIEKECYTDFRELLKAPLFLLAQTGSNVVNPKFMKNFVTPS